MNDVRNPWAANDARCTTTSPAPTGRARADPLSRLPRRSASTTTPCLSSWVATLREPPKPPQSGSRTTPRPCAGTACRTMVGKGNKPATMPLMIPVLRVLDACRRERTEGSLLLRPKTGRPIDRRDGYPMVLRQGAGIPRRISPHSLRYTAITNVFGCRGARQKLRAPALARRAVPTSRQG